VRGPRFPYRTALSWALCAALVAALIRVLFKTDMTRALALIGGIGPLVLVVPLPFLAAIAIDTSAWRRVFGALGREVRYTELLRVRLIGEAVNVSLPGGVAFAESLAPYLLTKRCGVPVAEAIAAVAAKKWLIMRAHAGYIALSAVAGFGVLGACSLALLGARGLPWLVLASSLVPLALSAALATALGRGELVHRLWGVLTRWAPARARPFLERHRARFVATDARIARLSSPDGTGRAQLVTAQLLYFAAWLLESLETLLILRLLGAHVGYVGVMSFEAGLSLLRCMAFFSPGGLGVQDLGYMAFLSALGIPEAPAVSAAFVVLKRSKEILWIGVGYALLLLGGERASEARAFLQGSPEYEP
jgi:glycosyltransferase 2 family protein